MKKTFFLLSIAALLLCTLTAGARPKGEAGIDFFDKTWKEVSSKARAEHKLIFLDIYASWCGPCKMLKRETFTNKAVGDYFNANFVNTSFDGEKGDGVMLAKKYGIQGYPALFILDADGNIVNSTMGFLPPNELLKFGKDAKKR